MTSKDKEKIRCLIARVAKVPPDTVISMECEANKNITLYLIEDYKGYSLLLGLDYLPTFDEVREDIKELYLMGVELEWEEENSYI